MKRIHKRIKNTRAVHRIAELLADVVDAFGLYGIGLYVNEESSSKPAEAEVETTEGEHDEAEEPEEDYEDGEYEAAQYYYDPADVQGALDEAISTLINERLIPGFSNPKNPPCLADVFALLFGLDSELKERAEYFEELISGYEDRAHIDNLREAYGLLKGIVDELKPPR